MIGRTICAANTPAGTVGFKSFRIVVEVRKRRQPSGRHKSGNQRVKHHRYFLVRKGSVSEGTCQYSCWKWDQGRRAENAEIDPIQGHIDLQRRSNMY